MPKNPLHEDEIDFLNVIKNPIRWFGIIYPYFLVIIIIGGIYYYNHMGRAYRNNVSPIAVDSTNVFVDVKPARGSISEGIDVAQLSNPGKDVIDKGANLYKTNCVSCHGEQGLGDGPAGQVMNPKPRNFHQANGWVNGRNYSAMFTTVTEGIANTGMPPFSHLPAGDRTAIVHYIRTFANDFPPITGQELSQLDSKYNLSKGSVTSSQIPIETAMKRITEEALPHSKEVFAIISDINNNPNDPGAQILNRVSKDKLRTVSFLKSSNKWNTNLDDFIKAVISSMNTNGFSPEVLNLNREEWNQLFSYLNGLYTGKNS